MQDLEVNAIPFGGNWHGSSQLVSSSAAVGDSLNNPDQPFWGGLSVEARIGLMMHNLRLLDGICGGHWATWEYQC